MESFQFIDIIFLAMVAGFIVLRLRSVLGRRTGHEPPRKTRAKQPSQTEADNVVSMPPPRSESDEMVLDTESSYQGTALEAGLLQVKAANPAFEATGFLAGAAAAFEMIVVAYAKNELNTLKPLLSPEVYSQFASMVQDRESRGESMETELITTRPPKLESVEMQKEMAIVSVRFQSEQVNVIKDQSGAVIDGDEDHIESVTDIWTFARDTSSPDPNWLLIATRSVE